MHDERVDALKEESLPQLLRELAIETTTLVRQEIDLAKVELGEKLKTIGAGAAMFGVAAVLGLGAFGALTAMFIAALGLAMPIWLAAFIVTVVYGIVALVAAQRGRQQLARATPVVPQQTVQSVKDDVEWVKTRAQSNKK